MNRKVLVQETIAVSTCAIAIIALCMGDKEIAGIALGGMLALLRSNVPPASEVPNANA